MSKYQDDYDDDYDDDDILTDDDLDDDDEEFGKRSSSGKSGVSGAGLPGPTRTSPFGSSGSSSGGSVPSPVRTPGGPGSSSGGGSSVFGSSPRSSGLTGAGSGSSSSPISRPASSPSPFGSSSSSSPSGGGSSPRPASSSAAPAPAKTPEKRDDKDKKDAGGGRFSLGGFGRGGDDKKPGDAGKKDAGGGSPLSKLGSKLPFGGGGDKDDKKAAPRKDDKKPGGGLLGKLPFGSKGGDTKKEERKPGTPASSGGSGVFGASSSSASSGLGGSRPGSGIGAGAPGGSGIGGAKPGAKPDKPAAKKDSKGRGNPLSGLRNLFGSRSEKPRRSSADDRGRKTAEVKPMSLSFDKRMELIGIFMMLTGVVLLLSILSPTQGSIPYTINSFLSKLFGYGAIAVPIAMLPVGLWMIMLRAGDETPLIDMQRVIGLLMLYVGLLTLFQYYDALSYPPGENQTYQSYLEAMRDVLLPLSAEFGRGGGRVGGEIYYQLISNIGEIGGFVVVIGWLIVAVM
ncbi:hypothetical protein FBR02_01720, partial [Anaerolineae bacterium CFX9]|nr:hypothetical protein [Anaerolineae bacterium CFX9]